MKPQAAALALVLALLLPGCRDGQTPEHPAETGPTLAPGYEICAASGLESIDDFPLVLDLGLPEAAKADILRIRDAARELARVELPLVDSGSKDEGGPEIVVAARSREACADLLAELDSGEFAIRVSVNEETMTPKICIAYKGGLARMCAVDTFISNFISEDGIVVPSDTDIRGRADSLIVESDIEQLRDPCILEDNGTYYAYGTGWTCFKNTSGSLAGPWRSLGVVVDVPEHAAGCHWAPEVHRYNGKFYMFTTYLSDVNNHRGCAIFVSDTPEGPFRQITDGHVTPGDWDAIDGTFYVDPQGQPWMVFVHEWTSTDDGVGRMAAAKLSDDLTHFISEPVELFRADDAAWATNGVTDGCWMYPTADGQLLMLWSNWDKAGYCVGIARSASGDVKGPWTHDERLLYSKDMTGKYDGGHGMLFRDADGQMFLSLHSPNSASDGRKEKPVFIPVREWNGTLVWDTSRALQE